MLQMLKKSIFRCYECHLKVHRYQSLSKYLEYKYISKRYYISENVLSLNDRGFWNDRFPPSSLEFEKSLASKSLVVYGGFDPTADSLHIGNLLVLNALIHFQRNGHKVIALVGGATGRVGDPSGKNKERPVLQIKDIEKNSKSITANIENIFRNHEEFIYKSKSAKDKLHPVLIVDNYNWYKDINVLIFLRDIGKHMRMGSLLRRTTIESRIAANEPLSYTEFSYQVMQAFDWHYLYKKYGCTVQVGGSDQMGNIASGQQLISRMEDIQVTGLTVPLITSESGDKLGKSSGTPIWLSAEKSSSFDFYQFFIRTKDSEVENLLRLLTFIPMSEIEEAMRLHKLSPEKSRPQKKLAEHLTLLVHGEKGLQRAKRATEMLFGGNSSLLADMDASEVLDLFKGSEVKSLLIKPGTSVLDTAMLAGCFPTEERAYSVIEKGGFYINQAKVINPLLVLIPGVHILPNNLSLLRVGKKNYYIVNWKL